MNTITEEQITAYVEARIGTFHGKRLEALENLQLSDLLLKNPYLFRSKNLVCAGDLVKSLLDAYLSSQEETLFGDFLEGLAIYVAEKALGGMKSGITGVDLEFVKDGARYLVSIKSGPNWGNSSQVAKMRDNFTAATRVIRHGNATANVIAVNGCCYGRDANPNKGSYFKYCGQDFWELISGDRGFYTRIVEPLGHDAKRRNKDFAGQYGAVVNRFTRQFMALFCGDTGAIDWDKLVQYGSASTPMIARPPEKRAVNRLSNIRSVCDVLRQWDYPGLAATVEILTPDAASTTETPAPDLGSLKGFLMVLGAEQPGSSVSLTTTPAGLFVAEWQFADNRSATITFLDIDYMSVDATDADGNAIRIRNGATRARRQIVVRALAQHGLLTIRPGG